MTATIIGIIDDGGEWPTISVQGDLDPSSLYTLQGWAFDEFAALAEDSVNNWDLESDGELLIENETTVVDQQIQQTEVNSGWGVTIIYRSRGEFGESGRNLLTEEGLTFIKEIENELLSVVSADGDISYDN